MKSMVKKLNYILNVIFFVVITMSCSKTEKELHVYSIIDEKETKVLCDLFTEKTGIPVLFLRASTGELVNRVIAEKDDPQADILLGGAVNYHIQADAAGALEEYKSPLSEGLPSYAVSQDNTWTGFCVLSLGIGINKPRFEQKFPNVQIPQTWDDLLNPVFKGEIVLTNPLASSTAYLFVQNQLQRLGWEKGWEYLSALTPLVGQFPDSGSAPAKLLGTGEYAIGVSYLHAIAKYKAQGFQLELVAPPKTVGDVDCIAIMKNTKHLEEAKKFVDFMLGKEAQELMSSMNYTVPVNPDASGPEGSIPVSSLDLIKYDVKKAAEEKDAVMDLWNKQVK